MKKIEITGAREHNLKNIDVVIPRYALTVITGLSGSGKSSLAFDTIYAEGQRRYMETLSSYARQFVGSMQRADVDKISGLSPVVAIEQKTTNKNPRSTVGTVTEINDFLRLLYARVAIAYSMSTDEAMVQYTDKEIIALIKRDFDQHKIAVMAPVVKGRKGHYRDLFESLTKKGYLYARIDGKVQEIYAGLKLDRYKIHDIEVVIDRIVVKEDVDERLLKSMDVAMRQGKGTTMVYDYDTDRHRYYSRNLMCPTTGESYAVPAPHSFSFNSPHGACPHCNGLGVEDIYDLERIVPDRKKSIRQGAIEPVGKYKNTLFFVLVEELGRRHGFTLDDPFETINDEAIQILLHGDSEPLRIEAKKMGIIGGTHMVDFDGVTGYIERMMDDNTLQRGEKWQAQFMVQKVCQVCGGARLSKEALQFRLDEKNIAEVSQMSISALGRWFDALPSALSLRQNMVAHDIIKEIRERIGFLEDVGLGYLSLSRSTGSLSGGESQRIRLATQIGSKLVNVLYILDEPSIGLHQRDNKKLIDSLIALRDMGNSVIVVEHDEEMMRRSDWIVDIGPAAGVHGGEVVALGTFDDILKSNTMTADYLSGRKSITVPNERRPGNGGFIRMKGASGNNLKGVNVSIPLGCMVVITGVSGSGKSTLINETLRPAISTTLYNGYQQPLAYKSIEGIEQIDKLVVVDQSPIGRTPRSNPATYTNLFSDIRNLFATSPDAKIRGFKPGRFSFNVKGGRCEECRGAGVQTLEMNFLPDVYVTCKGCNGKRYNRETLQVKYKGKNISDVLDMTVLQALEFFQPVPQIRQRLQSLKDVGLGYVTLGQPSTTLSGGESQRIKLAGELSKKDTGKTLYILDEPTTGLHFEDIRILLEVLNRLVERGNTVLVIEHNLDVIKVADYLIDMGPEGGEGGGKVVCEGTPEKVARIEKSYTGQELKKVLKIKKK